jgi:Uncharacterized conserved protein (some members contain a von Willebrand factor type A (vWA) domain)
MTNQVVLSAYPSKLVLRVSRRGYLLLGAMGGAFLLSVISNNGFVLALGGALGLFLLGEFYTVTLQLREFTERTEVTVTPGSRDSSPDSAVRVSLASVSDSIDVDHISLTGRTATNADSFDGPSPQTLSVPVAPQDDRVEITLTSSVSSPGHTYVAELTVVDADVPLAELYATSSEGHSGVTSPEQYRSESESSISGVEYDGLREYVAGDPLSHIDWKATARQDALHVREWARQQSMRQVIVIDLRSLSQSAWNAAVSVCGERLEQSDSAYRTTVAIVSPSGELVFTPQEHQTAEAKTEHVHRTVEDVSENAMALLSREVNDPSGRPLRQTTQVGKTVAAFRHHAGVADSSLLTALQRAYRQTGGTTYISLITGSRTTARTIAGVRSVASRGRIDVHLLSPPEQSDASESLAATLSAETGVSITERQLYRRGAVRSGSQHRPEYALARQLRG